MLQPGYQKFLLWTVDGEERARIRIECHGDHLILAYKTRSRGDVEWQNIRDPISLTYTLPNYGGRRAWFVCPSCRQRKRVLWGGTYYRCAKCYGMTHDSQYEDRAFRLVTRAQKIKKMLGGEASCLVPFPVKPKGMHWRTYNAHYANFLEAEYRSNIATLERFGHLLA